MEEPLTTTLEINRTKTNRTTFGQLWMGAMFYRLDNGPHGGELLMKVGWIDEKDASRNLFYAVRLADYTPSEDSSCQTCARGGLIELRGDEKVRWFGKALITVGDRPFHGNAEDAHRKEGPRPD